MAGERGVAAVAAAVDTVEHLVGLALRLHAPSLN